MSIDVTRVGSVATVTLNRPEALNAFDQAALSDLLRSVRKLGADQTVRAIILTGAGDRAFAAGADIKAMAKFNPQAARAFGALGQAVTRAIETVPQPVIAAVNGYAFGGGCEIALACDLRLAADTAVFAQPEVSLGIPPGWGATQRLPRLVGGGVAAELILTGRRVDATEALRIGLVNAVHRPDALLPAAGELAAQIAGNSRSAVAAAKQAMAVAFGVDVPGGLLTELDAFASAFGTEDQREGMAAFLEKRRPVWP
ncbi:MAG: 3-hydroxybutyryl-CoA dehydratase [uncultured Thermomicrobiales bacterium]|uniref:3-hydroxybutyryl-CoA dehydratase n=1 Tax=uncultured Thermomicrobiales bacterium TaxID=1645740 RepID=A0A6J4UHH2_9BACT|nr:MAG: 3-hydroxybutyryl-CoA dehydratase [uncultured Thermomicrobiales bacterium]